jgi:hypothetical protein
MESKINNPKIEKEEKKRKERRRPDRQEAKTET